MVTTSLLVWALMPSFTRCFSSSVRLLISVVRGMPRHENCLSCPRKPRMNQAQPLPQLQDENHCLKKVAADLSLGKATLNAVMAKTDGTRSPARRSAPPRRALSGEPATNVWAAADCRVEFTKTAEGSSVACLAGGAGEGESISQSLLALCPRGLILR